MRHPPVDHKDQYYCGSQRPAASGPSSDSKVEGLISRPGRTINKMGRLQRRVCSHRSEGRGGARAVDGTYGPCILWVIWHLCPRQKEKAPPEGVLETKLSCRFTNKSCVGDRSELMGGVGGSLARRGRGVVDMTGLEGWLLEW